MMQNNNDINTSLGHLPLLLLSIRPDYVISVQGSPLSSVKLIDLNALYLLGTTIFIVVLLRALLMRGDQEGVEAELCVSLVVVGRHTQIVDEGLHGPGVDERDIEGLVETLVTIDLDIHQLKLALLNLGKLLHDLRFFGLTRDRHRFSRGGDRSGSQRFLGEVVLRLICLKLIL